MAGDTAAYVLQTPEDLNAWYLIDLYESGESSQAAAIYGELRDGKSAGSLPLPDHLKEGVYWLRTQVDGLTAGSLLPVYVFSKPEEIEPEAQPPFQLQAEAEHGRLFAGTVNQLSYELWPRPLLPDGRLIVRSRQGDILADTLLEQSGKGIIEIRPEAGDELQLEVWLNEERTLSTPLPEVLPLAFDWQLADGVLELRADRYDSFGELKVLLSGPEGFMLEEPLVAGEILRLSYASWPPGGYDLVLMREAEPLLRENFRLRSREPSLHLQQQEIPLNKQSLIHARVDGIPDFQDMRWQLRVYSAAQQIELFSSKAVNKDPEGVGSGAGASEPYFVSREAAPGAGLDPERLEGVVKDAGGNPAAKAVVTLSGKGLERMFYTISDDSGRFVFDNLPVAVEERYLAAFERESRSVLQVETGLPEAPPAFPSFKLDSAELIKAKAYTYKHFLLDLLKDHAAREREEATASKVLKLAVPQEWISTFNTEDYIEFPSLTEFAQEVIPGLRVRYRDGKSYMQVLNIVSSRKKIYYKGEPLYLLNGYPVSSADSLLSIDMALIDKVELVRNNASFDYGRLAQYGIVAVYTRENDKMQAHLPHEGDWLPVIRRNRAVADFTAAQQQANAGLPDFREVIRWTDISNVQPDGSFSFVLNSSDEPGDFIVELTVYHEDGRLMKLSHPLKITSPGVP